MLQRQTARTSRAHAQSNAAITTHSPPPASPAAPRPPLLTVQCSRAAILSFAALATPGAGIRGVLLFPRLSVARVDGECVALLCLCVHGLGHFALRWNNQQHFKQHKILLLFSAFLVLVVLARQSIAHCSRVHACHVCCSPCRVLDGLTAAIGRRRA